MHKQTFDAKRFLKQLPSKPGVYRMLDQQGKVLYVGKARQLKNRVSSYFRSSGLSAKTVALVERIADIEITITGSESEALILEQNLIKTLRPPFNILLRDDKSYPYIYLSGHPEYPSLTLRRLRHRKKAGKGRYFGPYTSAWAVRESLVFLQKIFQIRQCDDSFFSNRTRPCLQHQIGRCSAPCVRQITPQAYAEDMQHAAMFLEGRNPDLIQALIESMEQASLNLEFEKAAHYRDQINALRRVQENQSIEGTSVDVDVFALACEAGEICIHALYVRQGRVIGSKNFQFTDPLDIDIEEIMSSFLAQFYLGDHSVYGAPREIICQPVIKDADSIQSVFSQTFDKPVRVRKDVKTDRADWLKLAASNARQSLDAHLKTEEALRSRWRLFCDTLDIEQSAHRVECFDISHTFGENPVGSCVVFGPEGPLTARYRRFSIRDVTGGDDYAAMEQALTRHYRRLKESEEGLPDVVLIDGGKGQLGVAEKVFSELQIDGVLLVGVAKGPTRKPGWETLIIGESHRVLDLPGDSAVLHLIQQVRDEAHRFAITGHRKQRSKARKQSVLETLPGIGPKRRKDLLNYFGSLKNLEKASVEEIQKVPGISAVIAESLYAALHE